jgi:MoxR-like ATPase
MREQELKTAVIRGTTVLLSEQTKVPERQKDEFVGRKKELALCRAAWCVDRSGETFHTNSSRPLHFRLHGTPGVGKNEIVYEIARRLKIELYVIQGHEEVTPEDLALLLVPDPKLSKSSSVPLILRASGLATAIRKGGLVFFDEINRVPERALAPLASVLDERQSIYSASTGIWIEPEDAAARAKFRFCCSLNPQAADVRQELPEYIQQRTLPVIQVDPPPVEDLLAIIQTNLKCTPATLDAFRERAASRAKQVLSVRQALIVMAFAMNYAATEGVSFGEALDLSFKHNIT